MKYSSFTWLHIKKSAGSSTRRILQPHYLIVDKLKFPKCFIQAEKKEYNDILNNYRVVLGEYQFKRALFAATFLYPNTWEKQFSFAFSRNPIDRCISMFHYLCWNKNQIKPMFLPKQALPTNIENRGDYASYAFDNFLALNEEARKSPSIYHPIDNHFTTHTNPMWNDVTDNNGKQLLTRIYRLEHLKKGINEVYEACNIKTRIETTGNRFNTRNESINVYMPSAQQKVKIESIYFNDFELYEKAH